MAFALQSLQAAYPHLRIEVGSCIPDLFKENWKSTGNRNRGHSISVPFRETAAQGIPYPVAWTQRLADRLGVKIPFMFEPPIFRITEDDWMRTHIPLEPFLVVNSGRKAHDGDCKYWGRHNWQAVVDGLKDHIHIVQVGGANDVHPELEGVSSHIGETDVRQLLTLISSPYCMGVLSHITFVYWLAVAQGVPTYCIANAREAPEFLRVSSDSRIYFAERGTYECPLSSCFRIRTHAHRDRDWRDKDCHRCLAPVKQGSEWLPACALAIKPSTIIADVLGDLEEGSSLSTGSVS